MKGLTCGEAAVPYLTVVVITLVSTADKILCMILGHKLRVSVKTSEF